MRNNYSNTDTLHVNAHTLVKPLFHTYLESWGRAHHRMFPWRATDDAYYILLAELMLRRTQARQVVAVYEQFLTHFPDVHALAVASPESVTRILFPLGLAWRVPAFQAIAHILVTEYNSTVPAHYETLLTLPGVGDYVASAVCCFAFGQARPIIDTNTVRVSGRLFHVTMHAESRRQAPARRLLLDLLDTQNPQDYNYALLDLAALVCIPGHPHCNTCPLLSLCATGQSWEQKHEG